MSTDRIKGKIVFACDGCDDHLETETDDFAEAGEVRRAAGWSARKHGDAWEHFCRECTA